MRLREKDEVARLMTFILFVLCVGVMTAAMAIFVLECTAVDDATLTVYLKHKLSFFFPPRICPGHISRTVTRRDSNLSVLLGPAV